MHGDAPNVPPPPPPPPPPAPSVVEFVFEIIDMDILDHLWEVADLFPNGGNGNGGDGNGDDNGDDTDETTTAAKSSSTAAGMAVSNRLQ